MSSVGTQPRKFETDFLSEYSDDALLDELRRIAALLPPGELLTQSNFDRCKPKVAKNTIQRRFGGWKEALEKAGISDRYSGAQISEKMRLQHGKSMPHDEVIAEIKRVHGLLGEEWVTVDNSNAHSLIEAGVVRRRFGSFRKALDAAGIQSHPRALRPLSDAKCFENLAEVWTHYGRSPQYREMFSPPSVIQGKTYVTRWKTWRKALTEFVAWANENNDSQELVELSIVGSSFAYSQPAIKRLEADNREIRPGLRFKVFRRDGFRCVACGRSPATHFNIELHADHIIAVANGGKTIIESLQTLCRDCNLGKGKS